MSKSLLLFLGAIVVAIAGYFGVKHLRFALAHEDTDDAQVEGDISPVLPRVSGYVTRVLIKDNDRVTAGQPLLEIDSRELDLRIANANANLQSPQAARLTAQANVEKARAALTVSEAAVDVAKVSKAKAADDLRRD